MFSIGLKLDVRGLLKAEIWASSTAQMFITTIFMCGVLLLGQYWLQSSLLQISWQAILVLGFALSFSSTGICRQNAGGKG